MEKQPDQETKSYVASFIAASGEATDAVVDKAETVAENVGAEIEAANIEAAAIGNRRRVIINTEWLEKTTCA